MAKRRAKQKSRDQENALLLKRRALYLKIGWIVVIVVAALFGYAYGYPLAAEGQVVKGILVGLAYGGGALGAILISFFLNRKLRGL